MTAGNSRKRNGGWLVAAAFVIATAAASAPAVADGMVTARAPAKVRAHAGKAVAPAPDSYAPAMPVAGGPLYGYYPYNYYYPAGQAHYYPPAPVYYYPPSRSCWEPYFARYHPC